MTAKSRRRVVMVVVAALLGLVAVPAGAGARHNDPALADQQTQPVLPLELDGRHVFWAKGSRTVANSDPSTALSNLIYHGGAIQQRPKVYLTFWGKEWADPTDPAFTIPVNDPKGNPYTLARLQRYLVGFFKGIGGTGWNNIQTQYCQGGQIGDLDCPDGTQHVTNTRSVLAGVWNDTNPDDAAPPVIPTLGLAENLLPDPIATEATRASDHFESTDIDATFFVFAPPGRIATGAPPYGGPVYCGYHSEVTPTNGGHGIRYAFIPYILDADLNPVTAGGCGMNYVNSANTVFGNGIFDGFSIVSGHEYAEAATDPDAWPFQDGWNDAQTSENGDKCAWIDPESGQGAADNLHTRTGAYAVQSMWSNAFDNGAGGCVMTYP